MRKQYQNLEYNDTSAFDIRLKDGHEGENNFADVLGAGNTVEVKYDHRASETGNLAIETGRELQSGHKSTGISVSGADYYTFALDGFLHGIYLTFEIEKLRQVIEDSKNKKNKTRCGANKNNDLICLPIKDIFRIQNNYKGDNMIDSKIMKILFEDISNKKVFKAKWPFECAVCGESVEEDGEFYFYGDKAKMCSKCKENIEKRLDDDKGE